MLEWKPRLALLLVVAAGAAQVASLLYLSIGGVAYGW
jgi:hypothetical protein